MVIVVEIKVLEVEVMGKEETEKKEEIEKKEAEEVVEVVEVVVEQEEEIKEVEEEQEGVEEVEEAEEGQEEVDLTVIVQAVEAIETPIQKTALTSKKETITAVTVRWVPEIAIKIDKTKEIDNNIDIFILISF